LELITFVKSLWNALHSNTSGTIFHFLKIPCKIFLLLVLLTKTIHNLSAVKHFLILFTSERPSLYTAQTSIYQFLSRLKPNSDDLWFWTGLKMLLWHNEILINRLNNSMCFYNTSDKFDVVYLNLVEKSDEFTLSCVHKNVVFDFRFLRGVLICPFAHL